MAIPIQADSTQRLILARAAESFKVFKKQIRLDLIKGKTGLLILLLTLLNLSLYISGPVFPVYLVNRFHFTDQAISIGMACFNFTIFLGSIKLEAFEIRLGRQKATGLGLLLMATFPIMLIFMESPLLYYGANLVSGLGWALVGGEVFNYLFERIPIQDHASGIAWYTMSANAALLVGSLLGPLLANSFGFVITMIIFAVLRLGVQHGDFTMGIGYAKIKPMDIKVVAKNRKAAFEYFLLEHFEAGISLQGSEIKSIRAGQISLQEAYVQVDGKEAWLMDAHIAPYDPASFANHAPRRPLCFFGQNIL